MQNDRTGRTPYNSLYMPLSGDKHSKSKQPKESKTPYNSLYIPVPPQKKHVPLVDISGTGCKKQSFMCCKHGRPCNKGIEAQSETLVTKPEGPDTNNLYEDVMKINDAPNKKKIPNCDDFSNSLTDKLKKLQGGDKKKRRQKSQLLSVQATAESSDENEQFQAAFSKREVLSNESSTVSKKKRKDKKRSRTKKENRAAQLALSQNDSSEALDNGPRPAEKERSRRVPRGSIPAADLLNQAVERLNEEEQPRYAYIGACTFKKAEMKTKKPIDISLYHKLRKTELLNDIDTKLPLFICYRSARTPFRHYPVHSTWISGHRKYFVEIGEPEPVLHANLEDLLRSCQKQLSVPDVDVCP